MTYTMTLNTLPVPKGRPRFYGGHAVTPPKTREYEKLIRTSWEHGIVEGPLMVSMAFVFPVPASYSKKKHAALIGKPHPKKPDLDNLVKAVLDGLNGVAYEDDSRITMTVATKSYGEEPSVKVVIGEVIE